MCILPAPVMPNASCKSGREHWQPDAEVTHCNGCQAEFGMLQRKHHCRACGKIFCAACSDREIGYTPEARRREEGYTEKAKRVCGGCYAKIAAERREAAREARPAKAAFTSGDQAVPLSEVVALARKAAALPPAARAQPVPKKSALKKTQAHRQCDLQPQEQGHVAEPAPSGGPDAAGGQPHALKRARVKFQSLPDMRERPEADVEPRAGSFHCIARAPDQKVPARITSMYMRL